MMKKLVISLVTASALAMSAGAALAGETTTTTTKTWTTEDGTVIQKYSTTKNYNSVALPDYTAETGGTLPTEVEIRPLPEQIEVEQPDHYSYAIINGQPVVVERSSRRIIHVW
jgi:ABC-type glycerol-3-phosphate transport system substrate-binding protein